MKNLFIWLAIAFAICYFFVDTFATLGGLKHAPCGNCDVYENQGNHTVSQDLSQNHGKNLLPTVNQWSVEHSDSGVVIPAENPVENPVENPPVPCVWDENHWHCY